MKIEQLKLDRAIHLLIERHLDGLIVYSNGGKNILRPNYFHYFSGCKPLGPQNAVILSKSKRAALLVTPPWDSFRCSSRGWIRDVRGTFRFLDDLIRTIKEFGIRDNIGVSGAEEMNIEVYEGLREIGYVVLADDIITEMAKDKTEEEIEKARMAGKVADAGYKAFIESSRPGITEYELLAEIEIAMRKAGSDDNFNLISSGSHNQAMHPPTDRRLREGDLIIAEISPVVDGQVVQICRTIVLGKATTLLIEKYEILVKALRESLKTIKPGIAASSMAVAMNKVISEAGYAKYCAPPYMRARGHGMGAGSIAPGGVIDEDTHAPFERGQVVVVHPNQYIPETGYLACGETVLVTETGVERLVESLTVLYEKGV